MVLKSMAVAALVIFHDIVTWFMIPRQCVPCQSNTKNLYTLYYYLQSHHMYCSLILTLLMPSDSLVIFC